jgi:hypothetical protein
MVNRPFFDAWAREQRSRNQSSHYEELMSLPPEFLETCERQKILIIEPFSWTPHVETGLELAEILSHDNSVHYVGPDVLRCVTDETARLRARIQNWVTRKRHLSKYVSPKARAYSRQEIVALEGKLDFPDLQSALDTTSADFEALKFENFDVGMGVVSSLITLTRDVHFDRAKHKDLGAALGRDAIKLYRLTQEFVRANRIDLVILFNGRVASARGIRRACEAMDVRYIVHERGSSRSKYALFDRATPHQPGPIRRWVDDWWRVTADPEAKGRTFLANRRKRVATSWYSFTGKQDVGHFPPRDGRKRVTFFTSSDDELIAIGDELPPDSPFCDQVESIRSVGRACRDRGFDFVVRFHPNTPPNQQELLSAAREVSPKVLEPSSPVDSYALMDSSDIVFTQNSTVGIEAAARGKPAFYAGRNLFEGCRSVRRIMNQADVGAALETTRPADPMDALRYANFLGEHGIAYRYYEPRGFLSGKYRGSDLNFPLSTIRDLKLRLSRGGT